MVFHTILLLLLLVYCCQSAVAVHQCYSCASNDFPLNPNWVSIATQFGINPDVLQRPSFASSFCDMEILITTLQNRSDDTHTTCSSPCFELSFQLGSTNRHYIRGCQDDIFTGLSGGPSGTQCQQGNTTLPIIDTASSVGSERLETGISMVGNQGGFNSLFVQLQYCSENFCNGHANETVGIDVNGTCVNDTEDIMCEKCFSLASASCSTVETCRSRYCYKAVQTTGSGESALIKTCMPVNIFGGNSNSATQCQQPVQESQTTAGWDVCYCSHDNCNRSPTIKLNSILPFSAAVLCLLTFVSL